MFFHSFILNHFFQSVFTTRQGPLYVVFSHERKGVRRKIMQSTARNEGTTVITIREEETMIEPEPYEFIRGLQEGQIVRVDFEIYPEEGGMPLHEPIKVRMQVKVITDCTRRRSVFGGEEESAWHITLSPIENHPFFARHDNFINIQGSYFTLFNVCETEPFYFDYYLSEEDEMDLMRIRSLRSDFVPGKPVFGGERTNADKLAQLEALYDYEIAGRALHGGNGIHLRNRFISK